MYTNFRTCQSTCIHKAFVNAAIKPKNAKWIKRTDQLCKYNNATYFTPKNITIAKIIQETKNEFPDIK